MTRRKNDYHANDSENYLLIFGSKPGKLTSAETKMAFEIAYTMCHDYDKGNITIQIPQLFDFFKGQDANLEIVTSPTLQPLRLMYSYNKVTRKIAHIFVNTKCLEQEYKNSHEGGAQAYQLFDDILQFDQVFKYKDLSTEKLKRVFQGIKKEVEEFEKEIEDRRIKFLLKPAGQPKRF